MKDVDIIRKFGTEKDILILKRTRLVIKSINFLLFPIKIIIAIPLMIIGILQKLAELVLNTWDDLVNYRLMNFVERLTGWQDLKARMKAAQKAERIKQMKGDNNDRIIK